MRSALILKLSTRCAGAVLVILNVLHLVYGLPRLKTRIAAREVSEGLATPVLAAWVNVGIAGIAFGVLLLIVSGDLAEGARLARKVVLGIAVALLVLGIGTFAVAGHHPGFLVISLLGVVVAMPILMNRAHFR